MGSHGDLTAALAQQLGEEYAEQGILVFHDHGDEGPRGEIVSWFGSPRMPERSTKLSELDIAVVDGEDGRRALVLIEVEESNDRPKTLLADAFATLAGTQICYGGKRLRVGPWTTLLLMARRTSDHEGRNAFLGEQIAAARRGLTTSNGQIGAVVIRTFTDNNDLHEKARAVIDSALQPATDERPAQNAAEPVAYHILERTDTGAKIIAEVRDGVVSGEQADYVREELEYWGYPAVPLEEALGRFRFANRTFIGFERFEPDSGVEGKLPTGLS